MRRVDFYVAKLAALFHDPAWKPWVISRAIETRGGKVGRFLAQLGEPESASRSSDKCREITVDATKSPFECKEDKEDKKTKIKCKNRGVDAHQLEAAVAVSHIFGEGRGLTTGIIEEILGGTVVDEADRLAATIDRWMLTYKKELERVNVNIGKIVYANPLDPRFKTELKETISSEKICKYIDLLTSVFSKADSLPIPLVYNLAYFLVEPLWYEACGECLPPADTRTPTHSVFDHVYATASMVNWVYLTPGSEPRGYIVKIDVAGIQDFISSARKTRDLWAGSWLISALAWYTVSEAVMLLGGDIVLSPYNPANHFFIATLLKELSLQRDSSQAEKDSLTKLIEKVEAIASKAYIWRGSAEQPIIPGTFFIALPCIDEKTYNKLIEASKKLKTVKHEAIRELLDALKRCGEESINAIQEYFVKKLAEGWRKIAEEAIRTLTPDTNKQVADFAEKISKCSFYDKRDVERYLREAVENPPIYLRVIVVDVKKEYELLKKSLRDFNEPLSEEIVKKLLFAWLFQESIPRRESEEQFKKVTVEPSYIIGHILEEVTSSAKKRYRECTVCNKLPAILRVEESGQCDPEKIANSLDLPAGVFSEGENLCPYCLIKRLLTTDLVLLSVMNALNLYVASRVEKGKRLIHPVTPSTCQLAALNQLLLLAEKLAEDKALRATIKNKVALKKGRYLSRPVALYIEDLDLSEEEKTEVEELLNSLEAPPYEISCLIAGGKLLSTSSCVKTLGEKHKEVCELLVELAKRARISSAKYYAIVRGDGDFFGKRIVRGALDFPSVESYVEEVLKAIKDIEAQRKLREVYINLSKDLIEKLWSVTRKEKGEESKENEKKKPVIIVTPSYYMALSRGQMITALYDAAIVTSLAGFPVYAGGDDVAALVPGYLSPRYMEKIMEIESKQSRGLLYGLDLDIDVVAGFTPGEIVLATRRNYWGLLGRRKGFHTTPIGGVYSAPVAFGRSYGVYIAHYRDPFTASWRTAGGLEELKDKIVFQSAKKNNKNNGNKSEKDITALTYGRIASLAASSHQAVILPNAKPLVDKEQLSTQYMSSVTSYLSQSVRNQPRVASSLEDALKIAEMVHSKDSLLSRSLYSDFTNECKTAEAIAKKIKIDKDYTKISSKLALQIFARNYKGRKLPREIQEVVERYSSTIPLVSQTPEEKQIQCTAPLTWLIVLSAKVLDAGKR